MRTIKIEDEIDSAIRAYPWRDMTIVGDNGSDVVIEGSISESHPFEVRLVFKDVQCITSRRDWRTNTQVEYFAKLLTLNSTGRTESRWAIARLNL